MTQSLVEMLAPLDVDEFFVDPMQAYSDSFVAMKATLGSHPDFPEIEEIITDKIKYAAWKKKFHAQWEEAWKNVNSQRTLPIWCDHESKTRVDMRTNQALPW